MTDDCDAFRIDVLSIADPLHDGTNILREVGYRCRLAAASALAIAAFVVAYGKKSRARDRTGKVGEDRYIERRSVAIVGDSVSDQNDGGHATGNVGRMRNGR